MDVPEELPVAGTVVLLRTGAHGMEVLLMRRPERGSFGGAWVFPGGKVEDIDRMPDSSEADDARRAGIRETFEEVGLVVSDLVALSRWVPPPEAPRRIRTWFFVARAAGDDVHAAADEVVEHVWITPAAALDQHAAGAWTMFPPTWMTLHDLTTFGDVSAVLAAAGRHRSFATRVDGTAFVWEGLRLETRELPWRLRAE
ncbi:hypothetical protein RS84_03434 [Microbacterium hydrocarbonoxydans]|jgi:8-oxo-dGTP pyrophosphatase MutT (NUDIX family)|uniref:Nudix hydrolase domain-containing protein n=1 Tax=Microbacterium hydrocarbonoxydans TaxID=273678 RepID=A0A0M2HPE5_9MICO|nr:NUDIX hydrolase [Microbacterium hydrocarbonoxydans]KJL46793.1 hypothetical protein RS84_03434 [Microbacterium hydrocarbonoxydans]